MSEKTTFDPAKFKRPTEQAKPEGPKQAKPPAAGRPRGGQIKLNATPIGLF